VARRSEIKRLFDEAEKALGPIDIVVANAGVVLIKPFSENTEEDFDHVFNTNAKGVFFTLQEATKRLKEGSHIIVVSSAGTKMKFPNFSLYLGSKGAIEQFVRVLAQEVASRNITVNVLSPGFTDTDMLPEDYHPLASSMSPFNRVGNSKEVADVAAFLASDQSLWITGQNIQANGGIV
jgi:3-oxoacyl-[acyl-carrier protein] reductase